jgi:hypothetical protein
MQANSGRSRLASSGSSCDPAGLLCIGLAMRASDSSVAGETPAAVTCLVNANGRWQSRLAAVLLS